MTQKSNTKDIEDWFGKPAYSPERFFLNNIKNQEETANSVILYLSLEDMPVDGVPDMTEKYAAVPVVSLNCIPEQSSILFMNMNMSSEPIEGKLVLYADTDFDYKDEDARKLNLLTEDLLVKISESSLKFREIEVSAVFSSYNSMCNCLCLIAERLLDKSNMFAKITVNNYSGFYRNDTEDVMSIASGLAEGYLPVTFMKNPPCLMSYSFSKVLQFDMSCHEEYGEDYTRYTGFRTEE